MKDQDRRLSELEALYRERFPHFVQVACAVVGDRDGGMEVVQEAFVRTIRSRGRFRGEGPLEAWVWRAVVNAARDAVRRPLVEVGSEPDAVYQVPEPVRRLAPLIAALPERQRLAVFLRYYADLDYRTIADTLEIEVGTVSATLATAHATLRKKLRKVEADA
ncbi:MAG TPA: sigma-70 family RNA polymerase sigma factor [Solirubrobacteraceae bacterium]|nr:sigma-70 family RNA polymerase sigma factor [Solirubrobacteraceae bacterium]